MEKNFAPDEQMQFSLLKIYSKGKSTCIAMIQQKMNDAMQGY